MQELLRAIPAVDQILSEASANQDLAVCPRSLLVEAIRDAVSIARAEILAGRTPDVSIPCILFKVQEIVRRQIALNLQRVINATGVIIHTNLGRSPLSARALAAVQEVSAGYSNLEFDLSKGVRGSRYSHVEEKLCVLTGAEAALIVNNNAAAVLLALSTVVRGREVVISRGQLVEVGGSFRIPEVLRQSGAKLIEVGTTNRTHLTDYEQAITEDTAAIMKVHTSNYRIMGFTSQPEEGELVHLARQRGIASINDLGSGTLLPITACGYHEDTVKEAVAAGFDIVTFSGDKLLGGGQAGIIVGKEKHIQQMKENHLLRALRIDKLSLAALEGTLLDYLVGVPEEDIPTQRMLRRSPEELEQQAIELAERFTPLLDLGWQAEVIAIASQAGGGSLPAVELKSFGLRLRARQLGLTASKLEYYFRQWKVPIIVRIHDDDVILDVRCLLAGDETEIVAACREAGREKKW
ncbi:MAG: selA [Firmicutes bacterium]|nr:selA [Bacillota bacterium]